MNESSEISRPAAPKPDQKGRLKNNLWFAYIVFLVLWSGCVYSWLGSQITKHELFARVIEGHPYVSDFVNVYNSASLAAACQNEKIDIYSPTIQAEFEKKLTAPVVAEQPFYLQYPPFLFSIVRPLAFFDLTTAWVVWCSLGMALLIVSAIYLTRSARPSTETLSGGNFFGVSKFTLAFVIAATVASFPTWLSIELGQTSLLLVPGLAAFWLLCQKHRYFLAGLASGVVMIKLQYLPPVFIIGFLAGAWPYLGGFISIGLILLMHSILTVGMDNVLHFPQALLKGESGQGVSGVAADQMQNLRGNLTLILGADNTMVHIISIGAFAMALALLAFLWWRASKIWWPSNKLVTPLGFSRFRVLASISTLIMLVVSPHCHMQDYLALVIPCIWLWFECVKLEETGIKSKTLSWLKGMILYFPLLGWPFFIFRMLFQLARIQPFFIWAVIVICLASSLYMKLLELKENE